ncbi:MAG: phosphotransferase [Oscillospiraceae bacterium]|nr:phosphotransferase [Oscillospiraceae bacterium]
MDTAKALRSFGIGAPCTACTPLPGGHLHTTYRVETADGCFILQKLRHEDPAALMENIALVTAHVRNSPGVCIPQYLRTADGWLYDGCWRMMTCLPGEPLTADPPPEQTEAAGFAVGCFDAALDGLNGLREVWGMFHATRSYFDRLTGLPLPEQYEDLRRMAAQIGVAACQLYDRTLTGKLPLRIVHGDTRAGNILVHGNKAAVIDLDTVGTGLPAYDLGDGIRSAAQHDGVLDRERFRAFTRGFLRGMTVLTEEEIRSLVPGIYSVAAELAVRYLIDLAEGCPYFRRTPEQTAERARALLAFAFHVLEQEDVLQEEVQALRSVPKDF